MGYRIASHRIASCSSVSPVQTRPVLKRCRDHALASCEPYGVWGGMTEDERIRLLNQRELAS